MAFDGYGMPRLDFGTLAQLPEIYDKARVGAIKERTLADLGQSLQSGQPIDYSRLAGGLAQTGDLATTLAILKLGEEQKASQEFSRTLGGLGQPQQQPPAQPNGNGAAYPQPVNPAMRVTSGPRPDTAPPLTRAPVQPTARVWGDAEAEAAGLYEPTGATPGGSVPAPQPRPQMAQAAPGQQPTQAPAAAVGQRFPGPVQSTNPAAGNIPLLLAAVANPRLGAPQREAAKALLTKALDDSKLTDSQKGYVLYQAQERAAGRNPMPFLDYEIKLKRAGAPPEGEKEYDKITGKHFAEYNVEIAKGAASARGKIASLSRLDQLISNPAVYTGVGGETIASLKRLGSALNIDMSGIKDGASASDAIRSISNQFALELRNPAGGAGMPGAMSDKDREFLVSMVPGLTQTPEGNELVVDYMKRVSQRAIDVERQRQAYVRRTGRLDEGFFKHLADWSDANPLFPERDTTPKPQQTGGGATSTGINFRLID